MKRLIYFVVIVASIAGCGSTKSETISSGGSAPAVGAKIKAVFIPKSAGNPFFTQLESGIKRSADKFGLDVSSQSPQSADATSQIAVIKNEVQRGENVIIISSNSVDALNETLDEAKARGTTVITVDSDLVGNESHRAVGVLPVDFSTIGPSQIELLGSMINYEGEIAILSATTDAPNQNAWIEGMKKALGDAKFAKMKLKEVVYGDDDAQKSATEMEALLVKYPNLKGVIAPTTVGLAAAARVVNQRGIFPGGMNAKNGGLVLTGLGMPNELRKYVGDGTVQKFQLWDPADMGDIAAFLASQISSKKLDVKEGAKFSVPEKGDFEVRANNIVIAGKLVTFEKSNIDKYKF